MTSFMSAFYEPLAKSEDDKITIPHNWQDYPALRPSSLVGVPPPSNTVLVKTGGNALQAVDRQALQQENVVAVTVPWYGRPGQAMLVRIPSSSSKDMDHAGRLVRTQIPLDIPPGSVFLVQLPPPAIPSTPNKSAVYTGIPVDLSRITMTTSNTRIAGSQEILFAAPKSEPTV